MKLIKVFVTLLGIALSINSVLADAFDDCIATKVAAFKKVENFSRESQVRCEGSGFSGRGHSQTVRVSFSAAPNYQIIGNIIIDILSSNRGNYGDTIYSKDDVGKIIKVTVPISCSSPSQPFGPGAWMKIRIRGKVEIPPTEQDLKNIFRSCSGKL